MKSHTYSSPHVSHPMMIQRLLLLLSVTLLYPNVKHKLQFRALIGVYVM